MIAIIVLLSVLICFVVVVSRLHCLVLTFDGQTVLFVPTDLIKIGNYADIEFDVKTTQQNATILAAGSILASNYVHVRIVNGSIRWYGKRFDLSEKPTVSPTQYANIPVANGEWHKINLSRIDGQWSIKIDDAYETTGNAIRTISTTSGHRVFDKIFIGMSTQQNQQNFIGQIRNLCIDGFAIDQRHTFRVENEM